MGFTEIHYKSTEGGYLKQGKLWEGVREGSPPESHTSSELLTPFPSTQKPPEP